MTVSALTSISLSGLRAAKRHFQAAAEALAQPLPLVSDAVTLSGAERAGTDWIGSVVDLRIQKYAMIANLRALRTGMELEREVTSIVSRR